MFDLLKAVVHVGDLNVVAVGSCVMDMAVYSYRWWPLACLTLEGLGTVILLMILNK